MGGTVQDRYTFHVEIGKGSGKYEVKYSFTRATENPVGQPLMYYKSTLVHSGYKKRLVVVDNETGKRKVLMRVLS